MDDKYFPILMEMSGAIGRIEKSLECLPKHEERIEALEKAPAMQRRGAWTFIKSTAQLAIGAVFGVLAAKYIK
jgi:hypothetical protein